ncbi:Histidine kinase-like ATPase domain-containing protein [Streptomyces sp. cf386]|nr:Histidine kinase-like ATPase domain-containing protein [Streptomyces sp. cf386]
MALIDGLFPATTDRPRQSRATRPGPTQLRAQCTARAVTESVPELRRFARGTARQWAVPEEVSHTLALVVSELVTNSVLHSGSTDITTRIVFDGVALTVEVTDSGRWLGRDADRRMAEDEDAAFGRGLDLVRACTSWCTIHLSPAGTSVVARLPVVESGADR